MARTTTRFYGDCAMHGAAVEIKSNGKFYCAQCGDWPAPLGHGADIANVRRIETPRTPNAAEHCSGKCVNGKHSCSCQCGGRCHGAGTCYCAE